MHQRQLFRDAAALVHNRRMYSPTNRWRPASCFTSRYAWPLAVLLAALSGAAGADDITPVAPGAALLKPFKLSLKQALVTGLARGPAHAIDACRVEAPEIAARLSVNGVTMGRSSDRLRNPANAAPEWVQGVLDEYLDASGELKGRAVELSATEHGYVEPIFAGGLCLNCHGAHLSPAVSAQLAELYPGDAATGYADGDFRGVFWIRYPATAD
ncbi:MAG: DUF3365 domain-containing protein, partial [Gammaproteobacteria bacterium]|nr:DUF3365 domain-containing protein [Gammaproteobacteria bacterium]